MQIISLIAIGGSLPEVISGEDFYAALNDINSINNPERIITIRDRQYRLNTLNINNISGTNAGYIFKEVFIPTLNGQTDFMLSHAPTTGIYPLLTIGGQLQEQDMDYSINGTTLTWLNNSFSLTITDRILIYYS